MENNKCHTNLHKLQVYRIVPNVILIIKLTHKLTRKFTCSIELTNASFEYALGTSRDPYD